MNIYATKLRICWLISAVFTSEASSQLDGKASCFNISLHLVFMASVASRDYKDNREGVKMVSRHFIEWFTGNNGSGNAHLAVVIFKEAPNKILPFDSWNSTTVSGAINKLEKGLDDLLDIPRNNVATEFAPALNEALEMLGALKGNKAIFLVSDGVAIEFEPTRINNMTGLKNTSVDVYTVSVKAMDSRAIAIMRYLASRPEYAKDFATYRELLTILDDLLASYCITYGSVDKPAADSLRNLAIMAVLAFIAVATAVGIAFYCVMKRNMAL